MGISLLENAISSVELDIFEIHYNLQNPKISSRQIFALLLFYTQAETKSEIFMEIHIKFGVEGSHLRELITSMEKYIFLLKDAGLSWCGNLNEGL